MSELTDLIGRADSTRERSLKDLPGPRGLAVLGNLLQLDVKRAHTILERWADEHGDFYHFRLGRADAVAISSPPLIDQILKSTAYLARRAPTGAASGSWSCRP